MPSKYNLANFGVSAKQENLYRKADVKFFRKVQSSYPSQILAIDLIDASKDFRYEDLKFIMVGIDVFSRKGFVSFLDSKNTNDYIKGLEQLLFDKIPYDQQPVFQEDAFESTFPNNVELIPAFIKKNMRNINTLVNSAEERYAQQLKFAQLIAKQKNYDQFKDKLSKGVLSLVEKALSGGGGADEEIIPKDEDLPHIQKRIPTYIWSDKEGALTSAVIKNFLADYHIAVYHTEGVKIHNPVAERFIRTMKEQLEKIFDAKQERSEVLIETDKKQKSVKNSRQIIESWLAVYNETPHSAIYNKKPNDIYDYKYYDWIMDKNDELLKKYRKSLPKSELTPKFKVGDKVHILAQKTRFEKGYTRRFDANKVFEVETLRHTFPVQYRLKDIIGSFYQKELILVNQRSQKKP